MSSSLARPLEAAAPLHAAGNEHALRMITSRLPRLAAAPVRVACNPGLHFVLASHTEEMVPEIVRAISRASRAHPAPGRLVLHLEAAIRDPESSAALVSSAGTAINSDSSESDLAMFYLRADASGYLRELVRGLRKHVRRRDLHVEIRLLELDPARRWTAWPAAYVERFDDFHALLADPAAGRDDPGYRDRVLARYRSALEHAASYLVSTNEALRLGIEQNRAEGSTRIAVIGANHADVALDVDPAGGPTEVSYASLPAGTMRSAFVEGWGFAGTRRALLTRALARGGAVSDVEIERAIAEHLLADLLIHIMNDPRAELEIDARRSHQWIDLLAKAAMLAIGETGAGSVVRSELGSGACTVPARTRILERLLCAVADALGPLERYADVGPFRERLWNRAMSEIALDLEEISRGGSTHQLA